MEMRKEESEIVIFFGSVNFRFFGSESEIVI